MTKLFPVKEAIRILCERRGYVYKGTKVERWTYNWMTTHRQGDYGVASERFYYFERKDGSRVTFRTATLRSTAQHA